MRVWIAVYLGLALVAPLVALAQKRWPERTPAPSIALRERRVDWLYWLVSPVLTGALTRVFALGLVAVFALATRGAPSKALAALASGHGPVASLHPLAQFAVAALVGDFVGYWSHRLRHAPVLFRAHAIHHSAQRLDWLAAARMHPLDDALDNALITVTLVTVGVALPIATALEVFFLLHTLLIHADVRWRFGPLARVFVSPALHRWHHAARLPMARGCNFAGLFALWDVLFGTFYLPPHAPDAFGAPEEPVGETLGRQLAYPLRAWVSDGSRAIERLLTH